MADATQACGIGNRKETTGDLATGYQHIHDGLKDEQFPTYLL